MIQNSEIPKGFTLVNDSTYESTIVYKSSGMGCLLPLLLISITSITCAFLYVYQNSPQQFQSIVFGKWWTPLAFAAGIFSVAYFSLFIIFHTFGETTFSINAQFLIIKKNIFCFTKTNSISRKEIKYFEQIKDGGKGDDTFPSWGLTLVANKKYKLLSRQPIEKSNWLGIFLSKKLGVAYKVGLKVNQTSH